MAAVTSDILNNMLRTSLTDLKSFVEVLNAELAEEGHGDENRASHKDNISQVLRSFGQCEAYLKKSSECLQAVETKINDHFNEGALEMIEEKTLHDEIKGIIKMVAGKPSSDDDDRPLLNLSIEEDKISQHLENVEDVLNEFHPLKLAEDDEDDEENEEEERMSGQLEAMQKKALSRLENRMQKVGSQDDEELASRLEEDDLTDSSGDDEFDYDSLERVDGGRAEPNRQAKKNMDARLKAMWNEYKQELANVQSLDTKQLFAEAIDSHPDVDVQNLKYFSQFNNNILELFSQEALLVVGTSTSFVDPITKKKIKHPVRNTICNHIYEKDSIFGMLKQKKKMRCPLLGCSCSFTVDDLEEDDDVAMRITQRSARQRAFALQDTENMETEDEDDDNENDSHVDVDTEDEDTQIDVDTEDDTNHDDTENADTQSQALF